MNCPPRLTQHLLAHTAGRLGMIFASQEVEVVECVTLKGNVVVEPELSMEVVAIPRLSGVMYVDGDEKC